ncbi:GGDEF domain-containing protein [Actinoplanes italicus]|uniref:Diguanylate cyclase (GGDEF)-like protein n=1 Tax=Actinoplanes italicus TaxID=113567 RepID=A0A2T0KC84_9ACTN|nr:GGDEF domain-containing protein [Actinoplanes italicus]PRX20854.1 diguanylate cyclase (GGDEF)-like protein [Actinoplanes italicus]GIE31329.1 GGDEF domain-containing protein [Actinoplanes italicus]
MTSSGGRLWLWSLLLGLAAAATSSFAGGGSGIGVTVVQWAAPLALVAGLWWRRPEQPLLWWIAAAGLALHAAAQAWWRLGLGGAVKPAIPTHDVADPLFYLAFVLSATTLLFLAARHTPIAQRRADALDGLIVFVGMTGVTWSFATEPFLVKFAGEPGSLLLFGTYEILDLIRISLAGMVVLIPGRRSPAERAVIGGSVVQIAGDVSYILSLSGSSAYGWPPGTLAGVPSSGIQDLLWLSGAVLIASGVLHPTAGSAARPLPGRGSVSQVRLVVFVLLAVACPVGTAGAGTAPLVISVLLSCLLVLRMGVLGKLAQQRAEALDSALQGQEALRAALEHRATHDSLTGLSNRAALTAELETAVERPPGARGWLFLIDLDGFKPVNDTLGHPAGDELLVRLGADFRAMVPDGLVARLGGDEFAVVLPPLSGDEPRERADALLRVAGLTREIAGHPVTVSASIGLLDLDRVGSVAAALHDADISLYAAKAAGRGCYRVHATEPDQRGTRAATGAR